ncbi:NUDIX hydrolase [Nocardioides convexus]|uniref:NUDIX domain-containing protein n=1 Tax=Nocardioides convexus TaxID=2712224 RepID=UPI002418760E|nr:NUDIX hydrolase [Nocardioides convexus]
MRTWQRRSTRTAYENPWIRVREDEVVRPDGSEGIYGVVEVRHPAVFVVPLTEDDEVVLVEVDRYTTGDRSSLEVPAGGTEGQEPLEAARRELREETGLAAAHWQEIGRTQALVGVADAPQVVYLARGLSYAGGEAQARGRHRRRPPGAVARPPRADRPRRDRRRGQPGLPAARPGGAGPRRLRCGACLAPTAREGPSGRRSVRRREVLARRAPLPAVGQPRRPRGRGGQPAQCLPAGHRCPGAAGARGGAGVLPGGGDHGWCGDRRDARRPVPRPAPRQGTGLDGRAAADLRRRLHPPAPWSPGRAGRAVRAVRRAAWSSPAGASPRAPTRSRCAG